MSINNFLNIANPPLIPANTNNDNNTTRIMETGTVYADSITDNIAILQNGYLTNLIEPTANNQIATKFYVDNSGGGASVAPPVNSVQYNNAGNFGGSANLTLNNPGLINETLDIIGTLTNGTITTIPGQINNLTNPVNGDEAATKSYVDQTTNNLTITPFSTPNNINYFLTAAETYNTVLVIDTGTSGSCVPPIIFAPADEMKTLLGSDFRIGKSWKTIIIAPRENNSVIYSQLYGPSLPITYYFLGISNNFVLSANFLNLTFLSIVTDDNPGTEAYTTYCISSGNNYITDAQITNQGVLTPSFANGTLISTGILILPVPSNPQINSNLPHVYTYNNLKQVLIIRTGLTGNVSDTFETAASLVTNSDFPMGGGTFKFFIQNPTLFDILLVPSAGWSFEAGSTSTITAQHCGTFWVTVDVSGPSCLIRSMGIHPLNG